MELTTKLIEYKINSEDIWCSDKFINVTLVNTNNLTTDEVHRRPLINEDGKIIGVLLEADEEHLYGYVYSLNSLYNRKNTDISLAIPRECVK